MQASDPLILAPCSARSRRSLATPEPAASQARRPALTAPARDAIDVCRPGRRNGPWPNKGTGRNEEQAMT